MQLEEFLDHGNLVITHYLLLSLTCSSADFLFSIQKPLLVLPEFSEASFGQLIQNKAFCPQRQQLLWV